LTFRYCCVLTITKSVIWLHRPYSIAATQSPEWKFKVPGKIQWAYTNKNYSSYLHNPQLNLQQLRIPKMPGLARDKWKDVLKHLLEDVLGLPEDSDIWKGLAHHTRGVSRPA